MKKQDIRKVYIPQNAGQRAAAYADYLRQGGVCVYDDGKIAALNDCDYLLLFLTEETDFRRAKADLNYALDHDKRVICVTVGTPEPDQGFAIQIGLAVKISDGADGPEQVLAAVQVGKKSHKKRRLVLAAAAVLAVAAVLLLAGGRSRDTVPAVSQTETELTASDELEMEPALCKALVANGLDADESGGISAGELSAAEELNLSDCGITDITPLAYADHVTKLDLSGNNITDVTALVALKNLQILNISGNPVENAGVLAFLPNIREVIKDD